MKLFGPRRKNTNPFFTPKNLFTTLVLCEIICFDACKNYVAFVCITVKPAEVQKAKFWWEETLKCELRNGADDVVSSCWSVARSLCQGDEDFSGEGNYEWRAEFSLCS